MKLTTRVNDKGELQILKSSGSGYSAWRKAKEFHCKHCDKPFIDRDEPSRQRVFCSKSCNITHRNIHTRGARRVVKHCVICRRVFSQRRANAYRFSTCGSEVCMRKRRSRTMVKRHKAGNVYKLDNVK